MPTPWVELIHTTQQERDRKNEFFDLVEVNDSEELRCDNQRKKAYTVVEGLLQQEDSLIKFNETNVLLYWNHSSLFAELF